MSAGLRACFNQYNLFLEYVGQNIFIPRKYVQPTLNEQYICGRMRPYNQLRINIASFARKYSS